MNKVILIGESHYHGLNLARSFGVKGIKPYGIVVNSKNYGFLEASKYWEKIYCAIDYEEAVSLVIELFGGEIEKPLIMPWSDGAVFAIDSHLDKLKEHFIVSSLDGKQGAIGQLLNKKSQVELAEQFGLYTSPTEVIEIPLRSADIQLINNIFSFPLFLKPVDSREGTKNDMQKIDSMHELKEYAEELMLRGFHRILVQEYLKIDFEYDFMGFCHKTNYSYTVARKIRTWPMNGGAACFGRVISSKKYDKVFQRMVHYLNSIGYSGPFDMDLFQVGDRIYFNEINWRSSANVYAAVKSGNNYPFAWYKSAVKESDVRINKFKNKEIYFMNEFWDIHYVMSRRITLFEWLRDVRKTDVFAFASKEDNAPFHVRLKSALRIKKSKKSE